MWAVMYIYARGINVGVRYIYARGINVGGQVYVC